MVWLVENDGLTAVSEAVLVFEAFTKPPQTSGHLVHAGSTAVRPVVNAGMMVSNLLQPGLHHHHHVTKPSLKASHQYSTHTPVSCFQHVDKHTHFIQTDCWG